MYEGGQYNMGIMIFVLLYAQYKVVKEPKGNTSLEC